MRERLKTNLTAILFFGISAWFLYDWLIGYPRGNRDAAEAALREAPFGGSVSFEALPQLSMQALYERACSSPASARSELRSALGLPLVATPDTDVYADKYGRGIVVYSADSSRAACTPWQPWRYSAASIRLQLYYGVAACAIAVLMLPTTQHVARRLSKRVLFPELAGYAPHHEQRVTCPRCRRGIESYLATGRTPESRGIYVGSVRILRAHNLKDATAEDVTSIVADCVHEEIRADPTRVLMWPRERLCNGELSFAMVAHVVGGGIAVVEIAIRPQPSGPPFVLIQPQVRRVDSVSSICAVAGFVFCLCAGVIGITVLGYHVHSFVLTTATYSALVALLVWVVTGMVLSAKPATIVSAQNVGEADALAEWVAITVIGRGVAEEVRR